MLIIIFKRKVLEIKFRAQKIKNGDERVEGNLITRKRDGYRHSYIYNSNVDETEIYEYSEDAKHPLQDLFIEVKPDTTEIKIGNEWMKPEEIKSMLEICKEVSQFKSDCTEIQVIVDKAKVIIDHKK